MSNFPSGPSVVHDLSCSDREFLAEVPVHGSGKKFGCLFHALLICLQRLILLNLCPEVSDQVGDAQPSRRLMFAPEWESPRGPRVVRRSLLKTKGRRSF